MLKTQICVTRPQCVNLNLYLHVGVEMREGCSQNFQYEDDMWSLAVGQFGILFVVQYN